MRYDFYGSPSSRHIDDPTQPLHGVGQFKLGFHKKITDYLDCYDVPVRRVPAPILYRSQRVMTNLTRTALFTAAHRPPRTAEPGPRLVPLTGTDPSRLGRPTHQHPRARAQLTGLASRCVLVLGHRSAPFPVVRARSHPPVHVHDGAAPPATAPRAVVDFESGAKIASRSRPARKLCHFHWQTAVSGLPHRELPTLRPRVPSGLGDLGSRREHARAPGPFDLVTLIHAGRFGDRDLHPRTRFECGAAGSRSA